MATLMAHITVVEGAEARFEELARGLFRDTKELEPNVLLYEYWRSTEPRRYYAIVGSADFRSFIAHQVSEHHESASPLLGEVIESIGIEWIDPVQGASSLPATEGQDALPEADELTRRYGRRYAVQIAEWWSGLR